MLVLPARGSRPWLLATAAPRLITARTSVLGGKHLTAGTGLITIGVILIASRFSRFPTAQARRTGPCPPPRPIAVSRYSCVAFCETLHRPSRFVAVLAAGAAAQEYIATNGPGPALGLNLSGGVRAEDSPAAFRDAAKTWGMYRIAVIQAAAGHPQDAKHTLWQIDQQPPLCPAEVTGVRFCCGMPIYDLPPMPLILYGAAVPAAGGTPAPQVAAGRMPGLQAARGAVSPPATAVAGRFQAVGFTVVSRRRAPIACRPPCRPGCRRIIWPPIPATARSSISPTTATPAARG